MSAFRVLVGETPEDPNNPLPFEKRLPFMHSDIDPPLAALNGSLSVVKWMYRELDRDEELYRLSYPSIVNLLGGIREKMWKHAAEGGHIEILRWLRGVGCPMEGSTFIVASRIGHIKCLQWALENGCLLNHGTLIASLAMDAAAEGGHLDILKWIHETIMSSWSASFVHAAAKNGYMDCIKWTDENGCKRGWNVCAAAAKGGHLPT